MTSTIPPDLDETPRRRRPKIGTVLALLVVATFVVFWIYAFSPLAPSRKADALDDESFIPVANARCATANDALELTPKAQDADTPVERAEGVDLANEVVADLVEGLRSDAAGATGRDRELLDLWLADWDAYLEARIDYADALRAGDAEAQFIVPGREGGQITQTMDGFARTNDLYDCLVPLDV